MAKKEAAAKAIGLYNKQEGSRETLTLFTDEKEEYLILRRKKNISV